jgi:cell division cycle 14
MLILAVAFIFWSSIVSHFLSLNYVTPPPPFSQNGDLNWIVKDKILAFAGPSYKKTVSPEGYCTLAPADYIPYFKKKNVALVVRLNKKNYEEQDFIDAGIRHLEQYYLDGSCPPMKILQRVLAEFEAVRPDEAFAVHCKAGLGRTGTCIGAYIMKHFRLTAPEVIAWMRICRPGCVIGPQQQFLEDLQPVMWQEGELMRTSITANHLPDPNTTRSSGKSTSSKNRSLKPSRKTPPSPESPKSVTANEESIEGRPGQADGLLARRNRQTRSTTAVATAPTTTLATPTSKKGGVLTGRKPVPVTPDT